MIYLIEKVEFDSMENDFSRALMWKIIGYTNTESEAIAFCDTGILYKKGHMWAVFEDMPQFRYNCIEELAF